MSRRSIICAVAGVVGLALVAGDATAAVHKVVRRTPTVVKHNKPQFHFRPVNKVRPVNKQNVVHQRFHKNNRAPFRRASFPSRFHQAGPANKPVHVVAFKHGPAKIGPVAAAHKFPFIKLANAKIAPIWKIGPKKIWVGGHWKVFIPFTAISVVRIGGGYFWPDAYVNVGRPYCEGITADGCHINWQFVKFEDGGGAYQCVQFCPRPNAPPPPQAVALVAPPPVPQDKTCEVTVFSEANLAGENATTGDEQPQLSQTGWQNQIASIQVKQGVWDFFAEENFTGNNMRLRPGTYQNLGPEWTKKINSFNCVMAVPPS